MNISIKGEWQFSKNEFENMRRVFHRNTVLHFWSKSVFIILQELAVPQSPPQMLSFEELLLKIDSGNRWKSYACFCNVVLIKVKVRISLY
jgi:hypothetical protein